jgi:hypothetical protein
VFQVAGEDRRTFRPVSAMSTQFFTPLSGALQ